MSILGYPFYPEASIQTLLLCLKAPNNLRTFKSDFFLASKKVQSAISNNDNNLVKKIKWTISDYSFGNDESRYALALNPCTLTIDNNNKYTLKVRIEYPESSEVILLEKPCKIIVEEGLFHYLQKTVGFILMMLYGFMKKSKIGDRNRTQHQINVEVFGIVACGAGVYQFKIFAQALRRGKSTRFIRECFLKK
ncbi:MAG: hypothetical protein WHS77_06025 [Brevinematales bacterium]